MKMLRVALTIWMALLATACSAQTAPQHVPDTLSPAGVVDPNSLAGADIGAKVNAAIAAMPTSGGTVRIPAGHYTFATTIKITRSAQHVVCDAGAVLRYTGSADAIVVDPVAGSGSGFFIDGEGGCQLLGTPAAKNGIHLLPGNGFSIRGMRVSEFKNGNGIGLSGANNVQILSGVITRNQHAIDMVTVPHYAPNAVHVSYNEIFDNDWGVYSHNGHVPATRALGNVYRDNVFEGNHKGDVFLGWDAHTLVEGNYFESTGVAVAAGAGGDKVFDIHIERNYFTVNGPAGYRSEVELGSGAGFIIEGNYEEGPHASGTGCAVNAIPALLRGGPSGVVLRNAFSRLSEGSISAHEFCYKGSSDIPPGVLGDIRLAGDVSIQGDVHARGAQLSGPLDLAQGAVASTDTAIRAGDSCSTEGMLLISRPANQPARLFFCSGARWQAVVPPHP